MKVGILFVMIGLIVGVGLHTLSSPRAGTPAESREPVSTSHQSAGPRLLGGGAQKSRQQEIAAAKHERDEAGLEWLYARWIREEPEAAIEAFRIGRIRDKEFVRAVVDYWAQEDFSTGVTALVEVKWLPSELRKELTDQLLLDQPLASLLAIRTEIAGKLGAKQPALVDALMKRWCEEDSDAALRWASEIKSATDRRRAVAHALSYSDSPGTEEWMAQLTRLSYGDWDEPVKALIANLSAEEACKWLSENGTVTGQWESWATEALKQSDDPVAALALADELDWYETNASLARELVKWAAKDAPEAYVDRVYATEDPEQKKAFVRNGIRQIASTHPEMALDLYQDDPAAFGSHSFTGSSIGELVRGLENTDVLLEILTENKNTNLGDYARGSFAIASRMRRDNYEGAREMITTLMNEPNLKDNVPGITSDAGSAVRRIIEDWPGEPQEVAAQAKTWADGLPEAFRDNALANLSSHLSTASPKEAIAFANEMTNEEGRAWTLALFALRNADWEKYAAEIGVTLTDMEKAIEKSPHFQEHLLPHLGVYVAQ